MDLVRSVAAAFTFDPGAAPGAKRADDLRIPAQQPKKMITFDRSAPPHLSEARAQCTFMIVRFDPLCEKTMHVTMHHTGWGDGGEWDKA
jgi:hypothetical protein